MLTWLGSITCGPSSLSWKFVCNSCSNEVNGDKVPDVRMIDLGFVICNFLKPNPALKHWKLKTLSSLTSLRLLFLF